MEMQTRGRDAGVAYAKRRQMQGWVTFLFWAGCYVAAAALMGLLAAALVLAGHAFGWA